MATLTATAEPLALDAGSPNVATLKIGGQTLAQAIVTGLHQTDWQGRLALSNQARTNLCKYSGAFSNGVWLGHYVYPASLVGGEPDPSGGTNAWSFALSDATGSPNHEQGGLDQAGPAQTSPLAVGLWLRADVDGVVIGLGALTGAAGFMQSLTTQWKYYQVVCPLADLPTRIFSLTVSQANNSGIPLSTRIHFFAPMSVSAQQLTGAYIPTTSAPVTVTDYTQAGTQITLGQNPVTGATLDWDGTGILQGANWSWPLALPKISSDNFAYAPLVDNVLVTQMETGAPKRRRRFTYVPETLTGTLTLTGAQAATLETFVAMALRDVQPFDWKDLRDGSMASYIFTKRPTFTQVAGGVDLWSTAIELMKQ